MRQFFQSVFASSRRDGSDIQRINTMRAKFVRFNDNDLRQAAQTKDLIALLAATAAITKAAGRSAWVGRQSQRSGGWRQPRRFNASCCTGTRRNCASGRRICFGAEAAESGKKPDQKRDRDHQPPPMMRLSWNRAARIGREDDDDEQDDEDPDQPGVRHASK